MVDKTDRDRFTPALRRNEKSRTRYQKIDREHNNPFLLHTRTSLPQPLFALNYDRLT